EPARADYPESDWRRRLAEELDRAITYGRSLAVVAWLAPDPAAIAGAVRLIDVLGRGDDGNPLLLLPEVERDQARDIIAPVLAASDLPVLVTGETGVGKENAAYAVHHWSKRTGPFIAVNCAAIGPESLIESELFGHDKGAFTGANVAKAGLFESASGGTVFLD